MKTSQLTLHPIVAVAAFVLMAPASTFGAGNTDSPQFKKTTPRTLPMKIQEWSKDAAKQYRRNFALVMEDWYRGKPGWTGEGSNAAINRFIETSQKSKVDCSGSSLWVSKSSKISLAEALCHQGDFHLTLIAWQKKGDSKLKTAYLVGDKGVPVSIVAVDDNGQNGVPEIKTEEPFYEGEGSISNIMKWSGDKFVHKN